MPQPALMHLKILLPFQVFKQQAGVARLVAQTRAGSVGFLPHRRDCVAALAPGILVYETAASPGTPVYIALDQGVLVKSGVDVLVSVRNALGGTDLNQLRQAVEREFLQLNDQEKKVRSVMVKMESGLLRQLVEFHRD